MQITNIGKLRTLQAAVFEIKLEAILHVWKTEDED